MGGRRGRDGPVGVVFDALGCCHLDKLCGLAFACNDGEEAVDNTRPNHVFLVKENHYPRAFTRLASFRDFRDEVRPANFDDLRYEGEEGTRRKEQGGRNKE